MKQVILWGGTGQAKVLAEALDPAHCVIEAIVDERAVPAPVPGVPLLVGEAALREFLLAHPTSQPRVFAVAIGGARGADRLRRFGQLAALGLQPLTIVHPRAFVARDARLGAGCQVLAMAAVCAQARLGRGVIVNTSASVDHDCVIDDGVHIAPGARLAGEVHAGARSFIGTGAIVLPRLRIGADAVVGAGAVVTRDVAPGTTVVGAPARPLPAPPAA